MWVGSLREGGIKELKKVHAYRKKLFDKERWERARKTKGQAMTFDDKDKDLQDAYEFENCILSSK